MGSGALPLSSVGGRPLLVVGGGLGGAAPAAQQSPRQIEKAHPYNAKPAIPAALCLIGIGIGNSNDQQSKVIANAM